MTNAPWATIDDFRDIESLNHYREAVAEGQSPDDVLRALRTMGRDNARTPVQWTPGPHAGFTTGEPWLPVNPNHTEINAEAERANPDSVFHHYRRLIELRHELPVIADGDFTMLLRGRRARLRVRARAGRRRAARARQLQRRRGRGDAARVGGRRAADRRSGAWRSGRGRAARTCAPRRGGAWRPPRGCGDRCRARRARAARRPTAPRSARCSSGRRTRAVSVSRGAFASLRCRTWPPKNTASPGSRTAGDLGVAVRDRRQLVAGEVGVVGAADRVDVGQVGVAAVALRRVGVGIDGLVLGARADAHAAVLLVGAVEREPGADQRVRLGDDVKRVLVVALAGRAGRLEEAHRLQREHVGADQAGDRRTRLGCSMNRSWIS